MTSAEHKPHSVQVLWQEICHAYSGEVIPFHVAEAKRELEGLLEQVETLTGRNQFLSTEQVRADVAEAALTELKEQLEAQREVLGWIASECARMEEYHTGFKWIGRRIHGLWVDFPAASYPASRPNDA